MRKYVSITLVLLIGITKTSAQQQLGGEKIAPLTFSASPNAASLGTYGQVPVNLFNGLPNININLYDLKVDNYILPISLTYNLSAVKPEQHPGWTGLGWNLNAGGTITRIVNGGVDEVTVSGIVNPYALAYYDNYGQLNSNDWSSSTNMINLFNCLNSFSPSSICAFPAPDEFIFNVNGLSGSFFKNHLGVWVVKANQKIDIKVIDELKNDFVLNEVGNTPVNSRNFNLKRIIYGFTLTTDDGIQYVFGKDDKSIEFTASADKVADTFNPNFIAKTWYLSSIKFPSSKQITFEYLRDPKATFLQHVGSDVLYYNVSGVPINGQSASSGFYVNKSLERTYNVYLNKIISDNIQIEFNKSLSQELDYNLTNAKWGEYILDYIKPLGATYSSFKHWYKLDNFIVKQTVDNLQIKKINFNYIENSTSRLFLNNIEESGLISSGLVKKHIFEYNPITLPEYNSQKIDHWGYYNNQNFFTSVTPNGVSSNGQVSFSQQQLKDIYPIYRNTNTAVIQAGVLTKILYPTKGFSEFYYEPNDFSQVVNRNITNFSLVPAISQNEIGGGLRIKKIISNPNNSGNNIIKEYFYVKDYKNNILSSSGILSGRPIYYEEGNEPDFSFWRLKSYSILPLSNTNGNFITYSNVIEKLTDGSFTEFNYANHDNGYIDKKGNNYLIAYNQSPISATINYLNFNSLESERGNLLSEKKYNNQNILIEKTNNFYNNDVNRFDGEIRTINSYEDIFGTPITIPTALFPAYSHIKSILKMTAYSVFTHQTYLKRTERTLYDLLNNTSITTTKENFYTNSPNLHQLHNQIEYNSEIGETLQTKYFYAQDPEMLYEPNSANLITKNMIGIPLDTQIFRSNEKMEEQKTQYAFDATTSNLLVPKNILSSKFPNPLSTLENKITFNNYDNKGNITQYTPENGTPITIIWGYNQTQIIAKIENATNAEVQTQVANLQAASNLPNNEANLLSALIALRTSLPNAMVTTYTHKPLIGVSTITDPKGDKITYNYDTFNRLQNVTDKNGNIITENQYNYKQ